MFVSFLPKFKSFLPKFKSFLPLFVSFLFRLFSLLPIFFYTKLNSTNLKYSLFLAKHQCSIQSCYVVPGTRRIWGIFNFQKFKFFCLKHENATYSESFSLKTANFNCFQEPMSAENSAQKKFSTQALIYVCGSIAKNYIKSSRPCQSRRWEKKLWLNRLKIQRILLLSIQRSIAGSWKIWKMFQKINGEFVDRGHDPIEKKKQF